MDEVEYAVQINGKVRDRILAKKGASDSELEEAALATPKGPGSRHWQADTQNHHRPRQVGKYCPGKIRTTIVVQAVAIHVNPSC